MIGKSCLLIDLNNAGSLNSVNSNNAGSLNSVNSEPVKPYIIFIKYTKKIS